MAKYTNPLAGQDYKNGLTREGDERFDALVAMAKAGRKAPNRARVEGAMYHFLRQQLDIKANETDGPAWKEAQKKKKAKKTSTVPEVPVDNRNLAIDFGGDDSDVEDEAIPAVDEATMAALAALGNADGEATD